MLFDVNNVEMLFIVEDRFRQHLEYGRLSKDFWISAPISSAWSQLTSSISDTETSPEAKECKLSDETWNGFVDSANRKMIFYLQSLRAFESFSIQHALP